jgi:ABC-type transport system involved in multi-copper enzyme maturation permease subunit
MTQDTQSAPTAVQNFTGGMGLMWGLILFSLVVAVLALHILESMSAHPWHGAMGAAYGLVLFGLLFGGVIFLSGISLLIGIFSRARYRKLTNNSPHPVITAATWAIGLHTALVVMSIISYGTIFWWLDSLG